MKRSILILLVSGLVLSTVAFSDRSVSVAEDSKLTVHMKAINKAMRSLRAQMKNEDRIGEANATILAIQIDALAAKALDPELLAEKPEGEQAAFRVAYRKRMHVMINKMFELEVALLEGRVEDAQAAYKAMQKGKSPAHKEFKKDED